MRSNMFHVQFLVLSFLVVTVSSRQPRRAGDQPPEGYCQDFKWGGKIRVHWYACCNNCRSGNKTGVPCDGKTYHSASAYTYCDGCGVDSKAGDGAKRMADKFACGGCRGQDQIAKECETWWRKIPGFCWSFIKCFEKKCKMAHGKGGLTPKSCYNGICEAGETPENCPMDCCYKNNPKCDWTLTNAGNKTCIPLCCSQPGCCNAAVSIVQGNIRMLSLILFSLLVSLKICE